MKHTKALWLIPFAFLLADTASAAEPLSLWVGQTKILTIPRPIKRVVVADPGIVEANKLGDGRISLVGKSAGNTPVEFVTMGGEQFEFLLHVTPEGGQIYATERGASNEPNAKRVRVQLKQARLASSSETGRAVAVAKRAKPTTNPTSNAGGAVQPTTPSVGSTAH